MFLPSFQRKIPPSAVADLGASFHPRVNIIPLIRWTIRSPPTPVPYSFQQRQRAKRSLLNGIFGASFNHVSQSRVLGDKSVGGGYSHAPVGSLRPRVISTCSISPIDPPLYSSRAFSQSMELTLWEPISTIRLFFVAAATISKPSDTVCDIGFSQ